MKGFLQRVAGSIRKGGNTVKSSIYNKIKKVDVEDVMDKAKDRTKEGLKNLSDNVAEKSSRSWRDFTAAASKKVQEAVESSKHRLSNLTASGNASKSQPEKA